MPYLEGWNKDKWINEEYIQKDWKNETEFLSYPPGVESRDLASDKNTM